MSVELPDGLLIASLASSAAWLAWNRFGRAAPAEIEPSRPAAASVPTCPPGFLPVLDAEHLFGQICADPLLFQIRQALGFAPENYAKDVQPLLQRVAEFVQMLPASESHHHANPGGLLTHALEVAAVALLKCEEAKLPIGRPTEEQLKFAARWRYGILVAALLHDIGKPIADVLVDVKTFKGNISRWNGLGGNLAEYGGCYRVQFPLRHDYGSHQRLPVMLLKTMVPPSTMLWLADDNELINTLLAFLSGEADGGAIGKLVKTADGKSVADNLLQGSRTRFATARQVPLIERMMDALRRMLAEGGHLPLNREGATGFCDGTDLWFVAGTLADKVRAYLDKSEIREAGAADLPTDNSRLFDTWLDYAAVRTNAGAAIWKAQVTLDKGEGRTWSQTFTMLRFPLEKLYADPGAYPHELAGRVELAAAAAPAVSHANTPPLQPPSPDSPVMASESAESHATAAPLVAAAPIASPVSTATAAPEFELTPVSLDFDAPDGATTDSASPVPIEVEFLDAADSAIAAEPRADRKPAPAAPPAAPTAPVAPAQPRVPQNSLAGDIPQPDEEIERLMAWIQQGVGSGNVSFNRATASVHFVTEGMLLISPKIFREFLQAGGEAEADATHVKRLQKLLQKSGYVAKNRPNSFLHYYRIMNAKNPERSLVTGYLVPNPRVFFNPVPEANTHLEASAGNGAS